MLEKIRLLRISLNLSLLPSNFTGNLLKQKGSLVPYTTVRLVTFDNP